LVERIVAEGTANPSLRRERRHQTDRAKNGKNLFHEKEWIDLDENRFWIKAQAGNHLFIVNES
jgi:hypothetical protein